MLKESGGGFWGNLFDFNGDGKTDIGNEWIAFKIFEVCMKDDSASDTEDGSFNDPYEWRLFCEDGLLYRFPRMPTWISSSDGNFKAGSS